MDAIVFIRRVARTLKRETVCIHFCYYFVALKQAFPRTYDDRLLGLNGIAACY